MSKKPLLSENQIAKWMKLANIDQNATQNFLTENKKSNKRTLKENMNGGNMGASYARGDEEEAPMGDEMDMGDLGDVGDGAMGDEPSVEEPMDMEADQGELEFDTVEDLKQVVKDAVVDALQELGLADELGGEGEGDDDMDLDLGMEGGDEGGDDSAEPAEEEEDESLEEGIEVLTDDEVINEVLKRVIRRLV